jgi:hypothetical protein
MTSLLTQLSQSLTSLGLSAQIPQDIFILFCSEYHPSASFPSKQKKQSNESFFTGGRKDKLLVMLT